VREEASRHYDTLQAEIALASDHYDFTISLLHLQEAERRNRLDEEPTEDTLDLMQRRLGRS
jgi:hypothetical protein